ncbi:HD domain-containing protein [Algoriphagus aquimarinus]|uniref:HD domain-containing protein n=1 Tax=Algoriphagus aquimarinus TaxID=237018 RepID=UPI0030DB0A47
MHPTNLFQQVAFIKEIDKLKYIHRKTRLFNSDRQENDAEHSWIGFYEGFYSCFEKV